MSLITVERILEAHRKGDVSDKLLLRALGFFLSSEISDMSLITQTSLKAGDLVRAHRAVRLANSLKNLKGSLFSDIVIVQGHIGIVVECYYENEYFGTKMRALKVLTSLGTGWTWDGIWTLDEKV